MASRLRTPSKFEIREPKETIDRLARFIRIQAELARAKQLVVGMSGGLDSSVTAALCAIAVGGSKVLGLSMPENETFKPGNIEDGRKVARQFRVRFEVIDITPFQDVARTMLDPDPSNRRIAWGNIKARLRATILYYKANVSDGLVIGTGDKSEVMLGYFCYDEKTRVLTRDGLKDHSELKSGDIVFSFDTETHKLVEVPVENVYEFDYAGEMYHFKSVSGDLLVTPNHRMLVQTSGGRVLFRRADESAGRSYVIMPVPRGWDGAPNLPMTMPLRFKQNHVERTVSVSIEDLLYVAGLFIGDGCTVKGSISVPVKSSMTRAEYLASARSNRGQFVSLIQPNPSLKTYETYETDFALPTYSKPVIRNRLLRILEKYGIGYSQTPDLVRISSKAIQEFFSQFGIGARNKRIPSWMLQYDSKTLRSLMAGLKDSDGSHNDRLGAFYTSSKVLKDGVVELLAKLGLIASVRIRPPQVTRFKNKIIRSSTRFEIFYSVHNPRTKSFDNSNTEILQYRGKVWCPSVSPFENVLVERNGKYAFCGNTKYGDGACDVLPLGDVYKTSVKDIAKHLNLPRRIYTKTPSPELWPGQTAEKELGFGYDTIDQILWGLERWLSPKEIASDLSLPISMVTRVRNRWLASEHKRRMPLTPKLGFRTVGMDLRLPVTSPAKK
ncbi:NAD(+) synthase [Candidatus Bathyarchaeota archaeon]|nr:MAG: NAD(+) synthase [Candidatus Bathyarchaeota archaeon]